MATDAVTGQAIGFPRVAGSVFAVTSDGKGGWYMGGDFTHVGGVPRRYLAHVRSDHTLDAWSPNAPGPVTTMLHSGTSLYFITPLPNSGGNSSLYVADCVSGGVLLLKKSSNGSILALAKRGNTLYVGGEFEYLWDNLGYVQRIGAAALDLTPQEGPFDPPQELILPNWLPRSNPAYRQHTITALAANESAVFVGGYFDSLGGQRRYTITALDPSTGEALPWHTDFGHHAVLAMALRDSTLYVGGDFSFVGGAERRHVAALDVRTGLARPWNPGAPGVCTHLGLSGNTLYAAVRFSPAAAWDIETGAARPWRPVAATGGNTALAAAGSVVYLGGYHNTMGAEPRGRVAALDAMTGKLIDWSVNAENTVHAIAVHEGTVYLGGNFERLNGVRRGRAGAVDAATGAVKEWNPNLNDPVYAIAPTTSTVYLGGKFTQAQGVARQHLAAFDAVTAALLPWDPGSDLTVNVLAVDGPNVFAGGDFTQIGGQLRHHLAALDASTGVATAWDPNANNSVYAFAFEGPNLFASGRFSRIGGQRHGRLAAIDRVTGVPTSWDPRADGPIRDFFISGSTVYFGGEFDSVAGRPRSRAAAVDLDTGQLREWSPAFDAPVRAMASGQDVVYAGGLFAFNQGLPRSYLGAIGTDQKTATLLAQFQAEVTEDGIVVRWQFADDEFFSTWLERSDRPEGPWSRPLTAIERDGSGWRARDHQVEPGRTYFYRVVAEGPGEPWTSSPIEASFAVPASLVLHSLAPNPASGPVEISFDLPRAGAVRMEIIDIQGRAVDRMGLGTRGPGRHQVRWSGRGPNGPLPSGVYFMRLEAAGAIRMKRLLLAR